ncbi:MAG TPA: hypothetical protein VGM88_16765 [Kofleriaceae bacterium]
MTEEAKKEEPKKEGFLQKYATLLSSTVLGVAGLAATSIWQFRQSATAQQQAESQQRAADTAAENSWKIERADILSKNIGVLGSSGKETVEQRYGVLLSLTRGNLLDPELAVSYALELGKDSPEDMQSVLANVEDKDYARLVRAFRATCMQRYGTSSTLDVCSDKLAERSAALAQVFADDTEIALGLESPSAPPPPPTAGAPSPVPRAPAVPQALPNPLVVLRDEHTVQTHIQRLTALFTPLLSSLYEDRRWDAITKFAAYSPGAHLVASLALSAKHTGEFVTDGEAKQLEDFHQAHAKWLADYMFGRACDAECKSRMLDVMVSHYGDAFGSYDAPVKQLLASPREVSGQAVTFLHTRLLWCQIDAVDLAPLRDQVLVPVVAAALVDPKMEPMKRDGLVSIASLVPEPAATDPGSAAWQAMLAAIDKADAKNGLKDFKARRDFAEKQRDNPPASFKKGNFCRAAPADENGNAMQAPESL